MAEKISKQRLEELFEEYLTYTAKVPEARLSAHTMIARRAINAITHYDELPESEINLAVLSVNNAIRIIEILDERRNKL